MTEEPRCKIRPMGEYGKPYRQIVAGCEFCKYNIECFLIANRNFLQEMRIQEEIESEAIIGYSLIDGYTR